MYLQVKAISALLIYLILGFFISAPVVAESGSSSSVHKAFKSIPSKKCNKCHDDEYDTTWEYDEGPLAGTEKNIYVPSEIIENSVHGELNCNDCHTNVSLKRKEHAEYTPITVSCIQCHKKKIEAQKDDPDPELKRLKVVMEQVDSYMHSVHAQPSIKDQSKTNASCYDCHEALNIGTLGSEARAEYRLKNPEVCGQCHEEQKQAYVSSIHGKEVLEKKNSEAAVCSDCHTAHDIAATEEGSTKLNITKNCGSCHEKSLETYLTSYHGQVSRLGYSHTAKCFDCHGGHEITKIDDPSSQIHKDNRLETCNKCHQDATEGFLSFNAHGDANNFEDYPIIYVTSKFMQALIIGVFLFFWTHVILWGYRELRDRQQGKGYVPPLTEDTVYFRRFSRTWRVLHLLFAVSTMILALSGSTLLFSHTAWAPFIIGLMGGPEVEAIIHRTAGVTWLSVFVIHFGTAMYNIAANYKSFRWFGPTSMVPNWQDLRDVIAMFSWFFGKSERPTFDRWSYWQKFDYWAPFWGAGIIGFSGIMLFAPTVTAAILPGYVFNIATIIHQEEALLATIFLFTVHFFNAHFRPDKFPMSTTIFTGSIPLDEFKHEHELEYERLKASGELEKHLVKKPSRLVRTGSNMLGILLIMAGLTLLTLVIIGYSSMH